MAALVRAELLGETALFPEQRYRFVHLLVQQVAYQSLLVKSRSELHARAGQALERLYVERPEEALQELARHYGRSADRAKALHYLVLAGDRARSLFAYDDAAAYYRQALHTLEEGDTRRALVLEKLGDTAYAHGGLGDALRDFAEALALCGADGRRAAELNRKLGWPHGRGERERAPTICSAASPSSKRTDNAGPRASTRSWAVSTSGSAEHERSMEWARRALASHALGARRVAHAYNTLGVASRARGHRAGGGSRAAEPGRALAHQLGALACRAYRISP